MYSDGKFRKEIYVGKVHLLSCQDGQVITTGEGSFDTKKLKLTVKFQYSSLEPLGEVVVVMQTEHGYFAKLGPFQLNAMIGDTFIRSYSMEECAHWPINKSIHHIFSDFALVNVFIKARHDGMPWQQVRDKATKESTITLTDEAHYKLLAEAIYDCFKVEAFSNYSTDSDQERSDTETIIKKCINFTLSKTEGSFTFRDLFVISRIFKSYWLVCHDNINCEIMNMTLGNDVTALISGRRLEAREKNAEEYRPVISIDTDLHLDVLAKMMHFYFNPQADKMLSLSSKIGLALSRLIGYRYNRSCKKLEHQISDIIFSLQAFAESYAQGEINKQNAVNEGITKDGIVTVVDVIRGLGDSIPQSVKGFYLKTPEDIYRAINRPSFYRSIEITAENLAVDVEPYKNALKAMEKARRQVVHSQDYDINYLINLLTQGRVTYGRDGEGKVKSVTFGVKTGAIDEFYDLLKVFFARFFEKYDF